MSYFDVAVMPVPEGGQEAYLRHAKAAAPLFKRHGATRIFENWGDDIPPGENTSFPKAVKCEAGETVAFSIVEWPDKKTRDEALPKVMEAMQAEMPKEPMPFDGKRLIYGGFDPILEV